MHAGFSAQRTRNAALLAAAALVLAACDDAPSEPAAPDGDVLGLVFAGTGAAPLTGQPGITVRIDGTVACPAGGTLERSGTARTERDGDVHATEWDFTVVHRACAMEGPFGRVVTDGTMHSEGSSRVVPPEQPGQWPELLAFQAHQEGTMTSTFNGDARTCSLDIEQTFEPDEDVMHIVGTSCGRAFDVRVPYRR
jgi:hypothetical protein